MAHSVRIFALSEFAPERRANLQRQIKALFKPEGWSGSDVNKWGLVADPAVNPTASLPFTLVALLEGADDLVVGTASIVAHDRKDLSFGPWLAGLVVHPSYRLAGIGTSLVQAIEAHAHANPGRISDGVLYLDTERTSQEKQPEWYERRGWRFLDENRRADRSKVVMFKRLD